MNLKLKCRRLQSGLCTAILALLLIGNLQPCTLALNASDMERARGAGFWSDPCTVDGFAVGAGAVLCATGSAGGCVTAFLGFMKALKVDKCF